ncbi:hypothetical protein HKX48_000609 [Thoreauomyces humboldtii]|nr:hypothetical protein HKX48_000609 [Thoreauomyces humboldtii]
MPVGTFVERYGGDVGRWKEEVFGRRMREVEETGFHDDDEDEGDGGDDVDEAVTSQAPPVEETGNGMNVLPQTPLTTTTTRRMTLRSHSKTVRDPDPPTPRLAIPLRNGTVVCDIDPTRFESLDDVRRELGDEMGEEAMEELRRMHGQLARLLGF